MLLLVSGATRDVMRLRLQANLGVLMTPRGGHSAQWLRETGLPWACDNDAFSGFDADRFIRMLDVLRGVPGCRFVSCPDVVGDAQATLARFKEWELSITVRCFPVALVAQDGLEYESIPWDLFDALFIGGSTIWKLGRAAAGLIQEAKQRGKWVHMGRVNSFTRIEYAASLGVDSIDGTHFSIEPRQIKEKLPAMETRQLRMFD